MGDKVMDITLSQNQLIKVTGQLAAEQEKTAQATEVIKQLVDDYDAGTLELDNEAVVTKARVFLDKLT